MSDICPIFERTEDAHLKLVGAWMQFPQNVDMYAELGDVPELRNVGPIIASFFKKEPCKVVPNSKIDLGNGCAFIGGGFVVRQDTTAPNEVVDGHVARYGYTIEENNGVLICVREQDAQVRADQPQAASSSRSSEDDLLDTLEEEWLKLRKSSPHGIPKPTGPDVWDSASSEQNIDINGKSYALTVTSRPMDGLIEVTLGLRGGRLVGAGPGGMDNVICKEESFTWESLGFDKY